MLFTLHLEGMLRSEKYAFDVGRMFALLTCRWTYASLVVIENRWFKILL